MVSNITFSFVYTFPTPTVLRCSEDGAEYGC